MSQESSSLQFISSFDQGSPRMINLLKIKADQGNLGSKDFAVSYCEPSLRREDALYTLCRMPSRYEPICWLP